MIACFLKCHGNPGGIGCFTGCLLAVNFPYNVLWCCKILPGAEMICLLLPRNRLSLPSDLLRIILFLLCFLLLFCISVNRYTIHKRRVSFCRSFELCFQIQVSSLKLRQHSPVFFRRYPLQFFLCLILLQLILCRISIPYNITVIRIHGRHLNTVPACPCLPTVKCSMPASLLRILLFMK